MKLTMISSIAPKVRTIASVFIEPVADGQFVIVHADGSKDIRHFKTQKEAIDHAKSQGHHPLVARAGT